MIETLVVAVDESQASQRAPERAAALAKAFGAPHCDVLIVR